MQDQRPQDRASAKASQCWVLQINPAAGVQRTAPGTSHSAHRTGAEYVTLENAISRDVNVLPGLTQSKGRPILLPDPGSKSALHICTRTQLGSVPWMVPTV